MFMFGKIDFSFSNVVAFERGGGMAASYTEIVLAGCILILPFLYESSHVFRYHLKFFLCYLIVMINSLILVPVFCFKPKNVRNFLLASVFCRGISNLIGLRWILRGREHLEKEQACIIVANHQSSLDILGMFDIWHVMDKCTVIAKKELFYAWPFGLAAWLCGIIYIPRVQSDKAKAVMNEAVDKIMADKTKLWIFPEGTRRDDGQIHHFKKGAFYLAIAGKLPIIPVVYTRYYFLDKNVKRFDHGKVIITALPQIETDNLTMDDMEPLMKRVRDLMSVTYHETTKEIIEGLNSVSSQRTSKE